MEGKIYPNIPPNPDNLPPQYGTPYPPQQYPSAPVHTGPGEVIVQNVVSPVVVSRPVGPKPSRTTCPSCRAEVVTSVKYAPTTKTHLIAILLCIFGCWCCVCIPYCTDSCRNADHYCPNCNSFIGAYSS
ncbi:lipopolysaccharide-induced tumor necrosis factor-alpha factor homolog [Hyposmocoma kahamanoa]|uniref:lipopolysaccharide-induced tumor necrosis factor-alpha factor homolog n=1 Tax=Hyposmocoma kahamanoa TaxID=1477025 RepID=UPI000E6D7D63|nr:lipopolysaccharide-induced tumor necrosis factor-alpha factor homolog [Hyposmocoma kahamanoa]